MPSTLPALLRISSSRPAACSILMHGNWLKSPLAYPVNTSFSSTRIFLPSPVQVRSNATFAPFSARIFFILSLARAPIIPMLRALSFTSYCRASSFSFKYAQNFSSSNVFPENFSYSSIIVRIRCSYRVIPASFVIRGVSSI